MINNYSSPANARSGVTLIELTVVIFVILSIMGATMYFEGNIGEWNKGKKASAALREVYVAQRSYLADNPRKPINSINSNDLIPYLPSGGSALPSVEDLNGNSLTFDVAKRTNNRLNRTRFCSIVKVGYRVIRG